MAQTSLRRGLPEVSLRARIPQGGITATTSASASVDYISPASPNICLYYQKILGFGTFWCIKSCRISIINGWNVPRKKGVHWEQQIRELQGYGRNMTGIYLPGNTYVPIISMLHSLGPLGGGLAVGHMVHVVTGRPLLEESPKSPNRRQWAAAAPKQAPMIPEEGLQKVSGIS